MLCGVQKFSKLFSFVIIVNESQEKNSSKELKVIGEAPYNLPLDINVKAVFQSGYFLNPECLNSTTNSMNNIAIESCDERWNFESKMKTVRDSDDRVDHQQSRSEVSVDGESIYLSSLVLVFFKL